MSDSEASAMHRQLAEYHAEKQKQASSPSERAFHGSMVRACINAAEAIDED